MIGENSKVKFQRSNCPDRRGSTCNLYGATVEKCCVNNLSWRMLTLKFGGFTMKSVSITDNVERQVEIIKVVSPNTPHSRYLSKMNN